MSAIEDDLVVEAKKLVADKLRNSFFAAGDYSGISYNGAVAFSEAIEALIEAKIAIAIEEIADRIEDKFGPRP